jgi:hypothetical protein
MVIDALMAPLRRVILPRLLCDDLIEQKGSGPFAGDTDDDTDDGIQKTQQGLLPRLLRVAY